jgi:hypothetical protein
VAEVEARGIERDSSDAAAVEETAYRMSQQPPDTGHGEQTLTGFVQRGEVRHGLQLQEGTQLGHVFQDGNNAAVVGFEKGLEHQARK